MATSPTWAAGSRKTSFTLAAHTDLLPPLPCQAKQSATSQHENGSTDDQGLEGPDSREPQRPADQRQIQTGREEEIIIDRDPVLIV